MTITRNPVDESLRERSRSYSAPADAAARLTADDPQQSRMMTASRLCGNKVINHQNETLGQIDEIVVDVPRGRIAYAAMASGGFLGLGERLFAVPWTALRYDAGRECFIMDARKETFENAPVDNQCGSCLHVNAYSFLNVVAHDPLGLSAIHTRVEARDIEPYGSRVHFKVWARILPLLIAKQPVSKFPELALFTGTLRRIGCEAGRSMHLSWQARVAETAAAPAPLPV